MKVHIDSVVDAAKFNLGLRDTTEADADLERLINQAAQGIDSTESYVVNCATLDVDCAKAKLPDDCIDVLCIRPDTGGGCSGCCNTSFDPETEPNPGLAHCNCSTWWVTNRGVLTEFCNQGLSCTYGGNIFAVQNGYLVFMDTITFTEVEVHYQGYNVDDNGLMVLNEEWERGLSSYASWKYASAGQNYRNYDRGQIADWRRDWTAQVNKIRGKAAQRDFRQNKPKFASVARAILISPYNNFNNNL